MVWQVKKKTKGLVSRTEKAVDEAAEVRDIAEDVSAAMQGLRPVDFDEDELMAELEAMIQPPPPPVSAVKGVAAQQPSSATITVSFPSVPSGQVQLQEEKGVEKLGLLASQG